MPYFTGDTVPLAFTCTDEDGAVNPVSATVGILAPGNLWITPVSATVVANLVSYNVPNTVTDSDGHYKAYFVVTLSYGERTHTIEFDVKVNPGG